MLDQGFEQAIRQIIGATAPHPRRQTALLSATWPQAIQALANEFLQDPVKVRASRVDGGRCPPPSDRLTPHQHQRTAKHGSPFFLFPSPPH